MSFENSALGIAGLIIFKFITGFNSEKSMIKIGNQELSNVLAVV